jgi:hypothetical protein
VLGRLTFNRSAISSWRAVSSSQAAPFRRAVPSSGHTRATKAAQLSDGGPVPGSKPASRAGVTYLRTVCRSSPRLSAIARTDGSLVLEGAALKVLKSTGAAPQAQSMSQYKGKWSEDRQLLWRPLSQGEALTLEVPVESSGKYEIKAKFTMAPDSGIINLAMDTRPLYQGRPLDFFYKEVRPAKLMSLGTVSLDKGRHRLTITVQDKNPKSRGYSMGLDEIQVVPVKK